MRLEPLDIRHEARLIRIAVQLLTRLPMPSFEPFEPSWIDRSTRYFPLVGVLIGLVTGAVMLAAGAVWPEPIPALLAIGAGLLITGALHEDGLADTIDGLGGGSTPPRRLEIMKDSRIGTYGVLALTITLALKVAALGSLSPAAGALALVAAHAGARLAPILMIRVAPYAGEASASKIALFRSRPTAGELSFATLFSALAIAIALGPLVAALAALAASLAAGVVALAAWRLIGGYTGDVLGAMEQAAEVAILLAASATLGSML